MNLISVLAWKYAGCEYTAGETYESLNWLDKKVGKPTQADIESAAKEYEKHMADAAYIAKRKAEYPDVGEQLDAIMKWVAGENEITVAPELKSMAMKCMAVKSKYPKPE